MAIRVSPIVILPAVVVAAVAGYFVADRSHDTAAALPVASATVAAAEPSALPPNHPAIPNPHGGQPPPGSHVDDPPTIEWSAPANWQVRPNPSPMRLATYKVGEAEMSVTRAGGGVDANVQRWTTQFEGTPQADRSEKQVHGLKVTVVRIAGTFLGGGMTAGPPERHEGWAMLAAIVDASGTPYFFKLLGPAGQVDQARTAFDGLVESVAPRSATAP